MVNSQLSLEVVILEPIESLMISQNLTMISKFLKVGIVTREATDKVSLDPKHDIIYQVITKSFRFFAKVASAIPFKSQVIHAVNIGLEFRELRVLHYLISVFRKPLVSFNFIVLKVWSS